MKKTLIVTSVGASFRRAGMRFTKQETTLMVDDLSEEQVEAIKSEKNLVVKETEVEEPDQGSKTTPSGNDQDNGDDLPAKLIEAIGQLDPENSEHYTGKGVPQLDALAELVGQKVTAAQRDEAFAAFSEQQVQLVQQPQE